MAARRNITLPEPLDEAVEQYIADRGLLTYSEAVRNLLVVALQTLERWPPPTPKEDR